MRRATVRRLLWGFAVTVAGVGGVVLIAPTPRGGSRTPSIAEPPRTALATTADSNAAEEIVLANVFSPSRTAPTSRYVPPADGDPSSGMPMESVTTDAAGGDAPPTGAPALFGTLVDAPATSPPRALLLLDPTTTSPRLYAIGEVDGGYRVISIAPRTVTLRGPAGRVILRLDSEDNRQ